MFPAVSFLTAQTRTYKHPPEGMDLTPTEMTETNETAEQQSELAHTHNHDHDHDHTHDHDHQPAPSLNPELTREIEVEVGADEVSKAFKKVVKRYQKLARIPGFRAGKVPESLIRSKFAKEVRQEVLESLVSEPFRKAIDDQKLRPVSEPQLLDMQLFEGQPLKFKAAFEVAPEFEIAGYESVRVAKPEVALTNDEFDAELGRVLDAHATVEPVDEERALVDGDWAEIQFRGEVKDLAQTVTEDGVTNASQSAPITGEDVLIEVGGKNTLAAFNDALRGAKPGQELKFEVDYPADFGDNRLAGQTVSYDVTVKSIKRKTYPERDAEFAKQLGNYESWDDFEGKLREHAAGRKKDALENGAKDKMLEELIGKYQFPVPESFVQQQVDARLDRGLRALAQQGMKAEDMRKLDFGRLRAAQRDQAVNEVKVSMILDKIAEAEGVVVSDEDLDRELLMISMQSREPLETLRERLTKDGSLERIREQMRREKTGSVLYEKLAS
ncbi:trigger factor [Edaphobacter dinghuensis]|uniref:Trigger factor n=2 Tax=Edaphobacter dinghuensis TaxID=1560005 RepID=A0A917M380_9BACT|nr:trigger factor [Edaphobacter dinghuensis]